MHSFELTLLLRDSNENGSFLFPSLYGTLTQVHSLTNLSAIRGGWAFGVNRADRDMRFCFCGLYSTAV